MGSTSKSFRIIVTYSGFNDRKDTAILRAARQAPSQTSYDPTEGRRSIDWTFRSRPTANSLRARLVGVQQELGGFSLSKVIDDSY